MANYTRKGFFPLHRNTGEEWMYPVDASNGANLFVGDIVKVVANGAVNPSAAGDATIVAGVVQELFDANKNPIGMPYGLVTTRYLPLSTAGYAVIALALPGKLFICQSDTVLTSAAIFATTDHVAGAGSTTTASSGHTMNGGDLNTGGQLLIHGPYNQSGNDITIAGAKWIVSFNESIFAGSGKVVGV